jgi:hypothetical protein
VCLTVAWTLGEVTGFHHSLEQHPFEAPWFYGSFAVILVAGGALVASGVHVIRLTLAAGVANALLLPVVLLLLWRLAREVPPVGHRLRGAPALLVASIFVLAAAVGLYAAIQGIRG